MSEHMNISVNGQSKVPPGFRFHPTEEELLHYYLKKKISVQKIDLDVIHEVDLNKLEPWDIQERCKIGTTTQTDWYFFSHKDKKYPSGSRTNRATTVGFWKATGRDKVIYGTSSGRKIIGMRKTLVFYTGRAPHGQKSDWIMYEYRLHDSCPTIEDQYITLGDLQQEEGWVVCRIFKKRNHNIQHETHIDHPNILNTSMNYGEDLSRDEDTKVDNNNNNVNVFVESNEYDICHVSDSVQGSYRQPCTCTAAHGGADRGGSDVMKWTAVDQLVACQLNGQIGDHDQGCFDPNPTFFTTVLDHHRHHQEMQLQTLTSLASQCSYSQICSLWDSL